MPILPRELLVLPLRRGDAPVATFETQEICGVLGTDSGHVVETWPTIGVEIDVGTESSVIELEEVD